MTRELLSPPQDPEGGGPAHYSPRTLRRCGGLTEGWIRELFCTLATHSRFPSWEARRTTMGKTAGLPSREV